MKWSKKTRDTNESIESAMQIFSRDSKKKKQNTAHKYEAPIKEMISQSS